MSAAHKTLPLPTYVKVTNLDNGRTVTLRVNDRGPFYSDRIIDLSFAAAKKLGFAETGTARVKVEGIDPQQWWAAQGRPVPAMMAQPQMAASKPTTSIAQPIEQYTRRRSSTLRRRCRWKSTQKRFARSLWPVSPGWRLRQSGCGTAAQGQAERRGVCTGVHQLGGTQPADPAPGAAGAHRHAG